ncbi:MAG: flagellar biosynthetic protein FliR, partial [Nitrospinaceae bacterium]
MDLYNLNFAEFETFLYVFFRVGSLLMFMPILGSGQVPSKLKVGLAIFFSLAIFSVVRSHPMPQARGLFELVIYLFSEVTIGLAIGYAARLMFTAVQVAGTIVDFQMGFGVVNVIDPQTESQVSITGQFQNIVAVLLFLALDAHHFMIQAVVESFYLIGPHQADFSNFTPEFMLT